VEKGGKGEKSLFFTGGQEEKEKLFSEPEKGRAWLLRIAEGGERRMDRRFCWERKCERANRVRHYREDMPFPKWRFRTLGECRAEVYVQFSGEGEPLSFPCSGKGGGLLENNLRVKGETAPDLNSLSDGEETSE